MRRNTGNSYAELLCGLAAAAVTAPIPAPSAGTMATPAIAVAPGGMGSSISAIPDAGLGAFEKAAAGLIEAGLTFP